MNELHGLLVLDKPTGITSRTALDRAQKWFPKKTRLGHTGTLDPLATGVLVLCLGAATRLAEYVQRMPKTYRAGIILGATSDTDDADGAITPALVGDAPSREKLEQELAGFVGTIEQTPPAYSAAKVDGRRAYKLARKGQEFELAPRSVTIHRIDVEAYEYPHLDILIHCGKGTYIRSLARDLGQRLGCGGYIASLRRGAVGPFTEQSAISLDADSATAHQRMLPPWHAVQDWPPITLLAEEVEKLRCGQRIMPRQGTYDDLGEFAVLDPAGRTFAIVEWVDGCLKPVKVLA